MAGGCTSTSDRQDLVDLEGGAEAAERAALAAAGAAIDVVKMASALQEKIKGLIGRINLRGTEGADQRESGAELRRSGCVRHIRRRTEEAADVARSAEAGLRTAEAALIGLESALAGLDSCPDVVDGGVERGTSARSAGGGVFPDEVPYEVSSLPQSRPDGAQSAPAVITPRKRKSADAVSAPVVITQDNPDVTEERGKSKKRKSKKRKSANADMAPVDQPGGCGNPTETTAKVRDGVELSLHSEGYLFSSCTAVTSFEVVDGGGAENRSLAVGELTPAEVIDLTMKGSDEDDDAEEATRAKKKRKRTVQKKKRLARAQLKKDVRSARKAARAEKAQTEKARAQEELDRTAEEARAKARAFYAIGVVKAEEELARAQEIRKRRAEEQTEVIKKLKKEKAKSEVEEIPDGKWERTPGQTSPLPLVQLCGVFWETDGTGVVWETDGTFIVKRRAKKKCREIFRGSNIRSLIEGWDGYNVKTHGKIVNARKVPFCNTVTFELSGVETGERFVRFVNGRMYKKKRDKRMKGVHALLFPGDSHVLVQMLGSIPSEIRNGKTIQTFVEKCKGYDARVHGKIVSIQDSTRIVTIKLSGTKKKGKNFTKFVNRHLINSSFLYKGRTRIIHWETGKNSPEKNPRVRARRSCSIPPPETGTAWATERSEARRARVPTRKICSVPPPMTGTAFATESSGEESVSSVGERLGEESSGEESDSSPLAEPDEPWEEEEESVGEQSFPDGGSTNGFKETGLNILHL